MPSNILTSDDLEQIGHDALRAPNSPAIAAELLAAVAENRLDDPADTGYALMLAAEIAEQRRDLPVALERTRRAIEAYGRDHHPDLTFARAYHAELLFRLDRGDEGLAELTALRPALTRDPDAAAMIAEALETGDRAAVAEQWLSAALTTVLDRAEEGDEQEIELTYSLAVVRARVRRALALPHDELDDLADDMRELAGQNDPEQLFWPRVEFERVLTLWPGAGETYGKNWDEHRESLERVLAAMSAGGETGLAVVPGSADGLTAFARRAGGPAGSAEVLAAYTEHVLGSEPGVSWPPGRNEPCWCGSGGKYKKCCLPRSR